MLGVRGVATLGIGDVREAVTEVTLILLGYAGRDLAQRVYRIRVEHEADLFASRLERVYDRLADQDLAQVADVDVARGADTGYHHVWSRAKPLGSLFGPVRYKVTTAAHTLLQIRNNNIGRRRSAFEE